MGLDLYPLADGEPALPTIQSFTSNKGLADWEGHHQDVLRPMQHRNSFQEYYYTSSHGLALAGWLLSRAQV